MWNPLKRIERPEADPVSAVPPAVELETEAIGMSTAVRAHIAEIEVIGSAVVATLTVAELNETDGMRQLSDLLRAMAGTGAPNFILDVQNVQRMDKTCLGALVETLNYLSDRGGQIALVNSNHNVEYIFRMSQLDRQFRLCDDVMAALQAFERPLLHPDE